MISKIRIVKILFSVLVLISVMGYLSCAGAVSRVPQHVAIYFSAGTKNELTECGCADKLGGLGRRKTVIDQCEYPRVVVEVGGFTKGSSKFETLKTNTLLKTYNAMNYAVINVGNTEYRLGKDVMDGFQKISKAPFISANLADEKYNLIYAPYKVIDVSGLKIGFLGLTSSDYIKDEVKKGYRVLDINKQAAKLVPELRKKCDILVVLASARDNEIEKMASTVTGIDVILGGLTYNHSENDKPTKVAKTIVHKNGSLGKYVGRLRLDLQTSSPIKIKNYEGFNQPLGREIKDDSQVAAILKEYTTIQKTTDFTKTDDGKTSDTGFESDQFPKPASEGSTGQDTLTQPSMGYTSALSCIPCHPSIYKEWRNTPHANAFRTLAEEKEDKNPQCYGCHTVGYKLGGFESFEDTPDFISVQCESCHGHGAGHIKAMKDKSLPGPGITKIVPEMFCTKCHNEEWDPDFKMEEKLQLIDHGKDIPVSMGNTTQPAKDAKNKKTNLLESGKSDK
jgi:hypothetical protein